MNPRINCYFEKQIEEKDLIIFEINKKVNEFMFIEIEMKYRYFFQNKILLRVHLSNGIDDELSAIVYTCCHVD